MIYQDNQYLFLSSFSLNCVIPPLSLPNQSEIAVTSPGPVQTKWEVQRQLISGPSSLNDIQYCNELRETHITRHDVNSGDAGAGDDGNWAGLLVSSSRR